MPKAVKKSSNVEPLHLAAKGERIRVSRAKLFLSPKNVRKAPYTSDSIAKLAALILSQGGVLQNLTAYAECDEKGKLTGRYAVCAGGRRLAAVELLFEQDKIPEDFEVPLLVVPEHLAIEASTVENSGREPMHPADECIAFKEMVDAGKSTTEIAAAFGVEPITVERRLKLANLAPMFLDLYREGQVELDVLKALALTDDHERQIGVWNALPSHQHSAYYIKQILCDGEKRILGDRIGRFVGIAAFEAAGGVVRRDLFDDNGDGYITDLALLHSLAHQKLQARADELLAEGCAWVDILLDISDYQGRNYTHAKTSERDFSEEEQTTFDALEAELDRVTEEMDALPDDDEEKFAALDARANELSAKLNALNNSRKILAPDQVVGAVIGIDYTDTIQVRANLIRASDKAGDNSTSTGEGSGVSGDGGKEKASGLSERLTRMLTAHRTAALQSALNARPEIALSALAARMAESIFGRYGYHHAPVQVSTTVEYLTNSAGDTIKECRAGLDMAEQREAWDQKLKDVPNIFEWLLDQPAETTTLLLAFCTACTINTVTGDKTGGTEHLPLAKALNLDMADWWQPTISNYLGHISKKLVVAAVSDALSPEDASDLGDMKRDTLLQHAEKRLEGTRWLPSILRIE